METTKAASESADTVLPSFGPYSIYTSPVPVKEKEKAACVKRPIDIIKGHFVREHELHFLFDWKTVHKPSS